MNSMTYMLNKNLINKQEQRKMQWKIKTLLKLLPRRILKRRVLHCWLFQGCQQVERTQRRQRISKLKNKTIVMKTKEHLIWVDQLITRRLVGLISSLDNLMRYLSRQEILQITAQNILSLTSRQVSRTML